MVKFVQKGIIIILEVYCEALQKLHMAIQNKRRGMMTSGVVLLHANACSHTAPHTQALGVV
jgi:hypothetical protein